MVCNNKTSTVRYDDKTSGDYKYPYPYASSYTKTISYTTNLAYNPADRLYVFISSSSDCSIAGSAFALAQKNGSSQTIVGRTVQIPCSVVFNGEVYVSFDDTDKDTVYATGSRRRPSTTT